MDPQGQVQIAWSAADDYGLTQVSLVYQRAGGKEERVALQTPPSPARRLRGGYGWELAPLKLRAGDKVSYHLEAKDNDAVDGAQRGVSATQAIKVFSAAEHSRESLIRAQALWERLVALAADRMEEKPAPPDAAAASAWYAQTAQKDRDARALSQELYAAGSELLKDKLAPKAVGRALRYASTGLGPATQRTSLARAPLSRGASGREGAVRGLATALQNEIREEEKDILYLEDLLDRARPRRDAGAGQGAGGLAARAGAAGGEAAQGARRPDRARNCSARWSGCASASRTSCRGCRSWPRASRTST